jgi:hypothetical protein
MKSTRWLIWILSALLVLATVDNIPDPAAMNPGNAQFKASCPDEHPAESATRSAQLIDALFGLPVHSLTASIVELHPYRPRLVLTAHAADPSPPEHGPTLIDL